MSNTSTTVPPESSRLGHVLTADVLRSGVEIVTIPLRFVAFWAAVALPFLYLPLLFGGLEGGQLSAFAGLLGVHLFALVAGHGYSQ